MRYESELFVSAGFRQSREILEAGCQIPPSYEVFCQHLKDARRDRPGVRPEIVAQEIADRYQRHNLFPGG